MSLTHAQAARLAHRVLRLRENGIDSETKLRQFDGGPPRTPRQTQTVRHGHPLALTTIAARTVDFLDEDRDGPTSPADVAKLMSLSLDDIWKSWDESVTANLESYLPHKDLKAWRKSVEKDNAAFEERVALMTGSSEQELVARVEKLLADSGLSDEELDKMRARLATQPGGDHEWNVHPYFGHMRHTDGAANAFYDLGREGFAAGLIAWTSTPTFKVILVDSADYTVNLATHQFVSSIASGGREETSAALANKTNAAGVLDSDDTSFPNAAGDPCEALVIAMTSALGGGGDVADTSQRLMGYIDSATGLPVTLNGGTVNVVWDSGSNRIAKL